MRFQPIELYSLEEAGRDELNNPKVEPVLIGLYRGTITQWSAEEIALLDRDVIRTQRKLLTDAPKKVIEQADQIVIDGEAHSIIDVKSDFIRWRLCHVREYITRD